MHQTKSELENKLNELKFKLGLKPYPGIKKIKYKGYLIEMKSKMNRGTSGKQNTVLIYVDGKRCGLNNVYDIVNKVK